MVRLAALAMMWLLLPGCDDARRDERGSHSEGSSVVTAADGAETSLPAVFPDSESAPRRPPRSIDVRIDVLEETLTLFPTVFDPRWEADKDVLPFMQAHRFLFEGSRILEIGTGSGVISLYAAKLGAAGVVATDINPRAVECAGFNARKLGYGDIMDVRLVSESDSTAFAVIGDDERFDVIISNPPYALVLDDSIRAGKALADRGDLGFSIIEGLDTHLEPDGLAALLYQSLFYQQVMIQYAQQRGFDVKYHLSYWLAPWELEALFESYTERFLEYKGLPEDFISFDHSKDARGKAKIRIAAEKYPPLIRGDIPGEYPGFIIVKRKE